MTMASMMAAASVAVPLGCAAPALAAATHHVYPGQSVSAAINGASPGDTVLIHRGTYPRTGWIENTATSAAPITVKTVDGLVVFDGGGSVAEPFRVGNSAYLVFDGGAEGFEVRNSVDNVVHIDGSHHITLRNMYAHDAGVNGDVVKVNHANNITLQKLRLARPGKRTEPDNPYQECLDFVDVDESLVQDSWLYDAGNMAFYAKAGSDNVTVERNVFSGQRSTAIEPLVGLGAVGDGTGGYPYEARNVIFRNNIVWGAPMGAVGLYDVDGAYIANNLLLDNSRVLFEFRRGNGSLHQSGTVKIANNLFVDNRGSMPDPYQIQNDPPADFATSHNLFWNARNEIPPSSYMHVGSQLGHLAADPKVMTPPADTNRDRIIQTAKPKAGTPAAGSGTDTSGNPYYVLDDIYAKPRDEAKDRGPYRLTNSQALYR